MSNQFGMFLNMNLQQHLSFKIVWYSVSSIYIFTSCTAILAYKIEEKLSLHSLCIGLTDALLQSRFILSES